MKTKTKKELQNELELLELQKKILEVKAEIIKLEDNRWESIPFIGGTYVSPYLGTAITNGSTISNCPQWGSITFTA